MVAQMEEDTQTIAELQAAKAELEASLRTTNRMLDELEDHLMQVDFGVAKPKTSEELVMMFRRRPEPIQSAASRALLPPPPPPRPLVLTLEQLQAAQVAQGGSGGGVSWGQDEAYQVRSRPSCGHASEKPRDWMCRLPRLQSPLAARAKMRRGRRRRQGHIACKCVTRCIAYRHSTYELIFNVQCWYIVRWSWLA